MSDVLLGLIGVFSCYSGGNFIIIIIFFLVGVSFVFVCDCFFVSRFVFLFVCLTKTVVCLSGVWVSVNFLLLTIQYNT